MDVESYFDTSCLKNTDIDRDQKYNCAEEVLTYAKFLSKNDIKGTGADISDAALDLARENARILGITDVNFIKSDLFGNISSVFDHILCNPPYIKSKEIGGLMEEVRLFEPLNALDGGEDGLLFYRRIAEEAKPHLNSGGSLIFETGHDEGQAVRTILEEAGYRYIEVLRDYSGNERVVKCLKS